MKMIPKDKLLRQLYPDTADANVQISETLMLVRNLISAMQDYDARPAVNAYWYAPRIGVYHKDFINAACSHCHERALKKMDIKASTYTEQDVMNNFYAFCPNCGAYMIGVNDDEKND